jgi:hypothetical protein
MAYRSISAVVMASVVMPERGARASSEQSYSIHGRPPSQHLFCLATGVGLLRRRGAHVAEIVWFGNQLNDSAGRMAGWSSPTGMGAILATRGHAVAQLPR